MSTLTYSRSNLADVAAAEREKPRRRSFWRRVYQGIVTGQQRRADRAIEAFLNSHGGVLTDDMEREIMQRLSGRRRSSV
jgi:hypothetical protein